MLPEAFSVYRSRAQAQSGAPRAVHPTVCPPLAQGLSISPTCWRLGSPKVNYQLWPRGWLACRFTGSRTPRSKGQVPAPEQLSNL